MSIVETEAVACCVAFWQAAAADHFREESFSSNSEAYDDIADKFNVLRHSVDAVDASLRARRPLIEMLNNASTGLLSKLEGGFVPSLAWVATLAEFTTFCFPWTKGRLSIHTEEILSLSANARWTLRNCAATVQPLTAALAALLGALPREDAWRNDEGMDMKPFISHVSYAFRILSSYLESVVNINIDDDVRPQLRQRLDPRLSPESLAALMKVLVDIHDAAVAGKLLSWAPFCDVHCFLNINEFMSTYATMQDSDRAPFQATMTEPRWVVLGLDSVLKVLKEGELETVRLLIHGLPKFILHMITLRQGGCNAFLSDTAGRQRLLTLADQIPSMIGPITPESGFIESNLTMIKASALMTVCTAELSAPDHSADAVRAILQRMTELADLLYSMFKSATDLRYLFIGTKSMSFFESMRRLAAVLTTAPDLAAVAPGDPGFNDFVKLLMNFMDRWLSLVALLAQNFPQIDGIPQNSGTALVTASTYSALISAAMGTIVTGDFTIDVPGQFWNHCSPESLRQCQRVLETTCKAAVALGQLSADNKEILYDEYRDDIESNIWMFVVCMCTTASSEETRASAALTLLQMARSFPPESGLIPLFLNLFLRLVRRPEDYMLSAEAPVLAALRAAAGSSTRSLGARRGEMMRILDEACSAAATPDASKSAEHHARRGLALAHSRRCSYLGCQTASKELETLSDSNSALDAPLILRKPLIKAVNASSVVLQTKLEEGFVPSMAWITSLGEFTHLCFPSLDHDLTKHPSNIAALSSEGRWSLLNCAALVPVYTAAPTALLGSLPREDVWKGAGDEKTLDVFYQKLFQVLIDDQLYTECTMQGNITPGARERCRPLLDPKMSTDTIGALFKATIDVYNAARTQKLLPITPSALSYFVSQCGTTITMYLGLVEEESVRRGYCAALADPHWAALAVDCAAGVLENPEPKGLKILLQAFPRVILGMINPDEAVWGGKTHLSDPHAQDALLRTARLVSESQYPPSVLKSVSIYDIRLSKVAAMITVCAAELQAPGRSTADVRASVRRMCDLADELIEFLAMKSNEDVPSATPGQILGMSLLNLGNSLAPHKPTLVEPGSPEFDDSINTWLTFMDLWYSLVAVTGRERPRIEREGGSFAAVAAAVINRAALIHNTCTGSLGLQIQLSVSNNGFWESISPETQRLYNDALETVCKAVAALGQLRNSSNGSTELFLKMSSFVWGISLSGAPGADPPEGSGHCEPAAVITLLYMMRILGSDPDIVGLFLSNLSSVKFPLKDYVYAADGPALETLRAAVGAADFAPNQKASLKDVLDQACAIAAIPDASKSAEHHARRALALAHSRCCSYLGCQTVREKASSTLPRKLCSVYRVAHYRADWKRGGHKYACKALAASGGSGGGT